MYFSFWPFPESFILLYVVNWNFPPQSTTLHSIHAITLCCFLSYALFPLCYLQLSFCSGVPWGQSKSEVLDNCITVIYLTLIFGESSTRNFLSPPIFNKRRWKFSFNCKFYSVNLYFLYLRISPAPSGFFETRHSIALDLSTTFHTVAASLDHYSFSWCDRATYVSRPYG